MRTSLRSQARTWIRPLRLSISIRPRASSGRVWSIGRRREHQAALARHGSKANESMVTEHGGSPANTCASGFNSAPRAGSARGATNRYGAGVGAGNAHPDRAPVRSGSARRCGRVHAMRIAATSSRRRRRLDLTQCGVVFAGHRVRLAPGSAAVRLLSRMPSAARIARRADRQQQRSRERHGARRRGLRQRRRPGSITARAAMRAAISGHRSRAGGVSRSQASARIERVPSRMRHSIHGRCHVDVHHCSPTLCAAARARDAAAPWNYRPPCRAHRRFPRASSLRRRAAPAPRGRAAAASPPHVPGPATTRSHAPPNPACRAGRAHRRRHRPAAACAAHAIPSARC